MIKSVKAIGSEINCYISEVSCPYISAFVEYYEKDEYDKNTTILHSWNETLPSENPNDYMVIEWDIKLKSGCIYENILMDAYISDITSHKDAVLISNTVASAVLNYVNKLSEDQIMVLVSVYIKDLDNTVDYQNICQKELLI